MEFKVSEINFKTLKHLIYLFKADAKTKSTHLQQSIYNKSPLHLIRLLFITKTYGMIYFINSKFKIYQDK